MTNQAYVELLKDPRWQKRRLHIFNRDHWACQSCGATEKSLQVHHLRYERGKPPWDSPDDALTTLCDACHWATTDLKRLIRHLLDRASFASLARVAGYLRAMEIQGSPDGRVQLRDWRHAYGIGDALGVDVDDVLAARDPRDEVSGEQLLALPVRKRRWRGR